MRLIRYPLGIYFLGLLAFLAWLAVTLQVNPFDSFVIYLNARGIQEGGMHFYYHVRPPLLPAVLAPLFWVEKKWGIEAFALIGSRILAVSFFGLLLWTAYRIFRLSFDRTISWAGVLLLSLNRLLIHHAPFSREDIPGSLCLAAAFYFYLRSERRPAFWLYPVTGFLIACSMHLRYQMIVVPFLVLMVYEIVKRLRSRTPEKKPGFRKFLWLIVFPVGLWLLGIAVIYHHMDIALFHEAPRKFFANLSWHFDNINTAESPWENFAFLYTAMTWPVLILAGLGVFVALKDRTTVSFFHFLWLIVFLGLQTFVIGHKEARYLFPVFIPLYYFVLYAIGYLLQKRLRAVKIVLVLLAIAFPVREGLAEILHFRDPFYFSPYEERVCREADQLAGDKKLYWIGHMYTLHPKNFIFHESDENSYVYHFFNHVCQFYTGRIIPIYAGEIKTPAKEESGIFIPNAGIYLEDGDALLINPNPTGYMASDMPDRIAPMILQKMRKMDFGTGAALTPFGKSFRSAELKGSQVDLVEKDGQLHIRGQGLPNAYYEVYFLGKGEPIVRLVKPQDGMFYLSLNGRKADEITSVKIVFYEKMSGFEHP